jgi:hypothetical protein
MKRIFVMLLLPYAVPAGEQGVGRRRTKIKSRLISSIEEKCAAKTCNKKRSSINALLKIFFLQKQLYCR